MQRNLTITFLKNSFRIKSIRIKTFKDFRFPLKYFFWGRNQNGDHLLHHVTSIICEINSNGECAKDTEYFFEIKRDKRFPLNAVIIGNEGKDSLGTYCNSLGAIEFYEDIISIVKNRPNNPTYNLIMFMVFQD